MTPTPPTTERKRTGRRWQETGGTGARNNESEKECERCGVKMPKDNHYCPHCGLKQPAFVECPVCMDTLVTSYTNCGHPLCNECNKKLRERKCPTCRKPIGNRRMSGIAAQAASQAASQPAPQAGLQPAPQAVPQAASQPAQPQGRVANGISREVEFARGSDVGGTCLGGNLHDWEFDSSRSSYERDIEAYKCRRCGLQVYESNEVYKDDIRLKKELDRLRQERCEATTGHRWVRTGSSYAHDLEFYQCILCGKRETR